MKYAPQEAKNEATIGLTSAVAIGTGVMIGPGIVAAVLYERFFLGIWFERQKRRLEGLAR